MSGPRARSRPNARAEKGETLVRLVTSFETQEREIDALVGLALAAPEPAPAR